MIIKRGFSLFGIFSKCKVYINGELKAKLPIFKEVDVHIDEEDFELYIESGIILESKRRVPSNIDIDKIIVSVNPLIRWTFIFLLIDLFIFDLLEDFSIQTLPRYIRSFVTAGILFFWFIIWYFVDTLKIKYYDSSGNILKINDLDENNIKKNDN